MKCICRDTAAASDEFRYGDWEGLYYQRNVIVLGKTLPKGIQ